MSLYKSITNEAIDEDNKVYRQALEKAKRNILDTKEKIKPNSQLDGVRRSVFKQNLGLFEKYIYKLFAYIASRNVYEYKDEPTEINLADLTAILADIVITYNNITTFLDQINYKDLYEPDKIYIDNRIAKYVDLLSKIENDLYKIVPDSLLLPISNIKNDIMLKNYQPVSYFGRDKTQLSNILRRRGQLQIPFTQQQLEGDEETPAEMEARRQLQKDIFEGRVPRRVRQATRPVSPALVASQPASPPATRPGSPGGLQFQ